MRVLVRQETAHLVQAKVLYNHGVVGAAGGNSEVH